MGEISLMSAAATRPAAARREILQGRHAAQFKSLADILYHRLLDLVHLLLGIEELARHRVAQEEFAILLEFEDLGLVQWHTELLLLLERVPFFHDQLVLPLGHVVGQKRFDPLTHLAELWLINNGLAEILRLLD